jgi:hypothetical protein
VTRLYGYNGQPRPYSREKPVKYSVEGFRAVFGTGMADKGVKFEVEGRRVLMAYIPPGEIYGNEWYWMYAECKDAARAEELYAELAVMAALS